MDSALGGARQQMPHDLAVLLRTLHAADDPLFNTVLAAACSKGWKMPALADILGMGLMALRKRIERARRAMAEEESLARALRWRRRLARRWPDSTEAQAWLDMRDRVLRHEQVRARVARFAIPEPPQVRTMIDGRKLKPQQIAALRQMQQTARKVNGAMPAGHPDRRVSEAFSAELHRLIAVEHFTPYYLSRELGISHRAVTSRLERHQMRTPCPSVAGTASGSYFARKIGDPGQGAPRVTDEQRAQLRSLWQQHADGKRGAQRRLTAKLREYLVQGFTVANLAQTMSTRDMRVRYSALQAVLAEARQPAGAGSR